MPRKKQVAKQEVPAEEYLDSHLMSHRLLYKRQLSVRIDGRYGTYRTRLRLGRPGMVRALARRMCFPASTSALYAPRGASAPRASSTLSLSSSSCHSGRRRLWSHRSLISS